MHRLRRQLLYFETVFLELTLRGQQLLGSLLDRAGLAADPIEIGGASRLEGARRSHAHGKRSARAWRFGRRTALIRHLVDRWH